MESRHLSNQKQHKRRHTTPQAEETYPQDKTTSSRVHPQILLTPGSILQLQRTIGNWATQHLMKSREITAVPPHIQREEWWDTLGEKMSGVWDTAAGAAESVWDVFTGSEKKNEKPKRPAKPDHAAEYEVTDKEALIRTPPPDLDHEPFNGMLIPKGTKVKVVSEHRKSGKLYVEVEVIPYPIGLPSGWTKYSNLSLSGGTPEPEAPSDDDRKSLTEELEEIGKIKPSKYTDQPGDEAKREKVIELANSADAQALASLTEKLKEAQPDLTPEKWFAGLNPSATFLGKPINGSQTFRRKKLGGVHNELYERLKVAEQILMDETGLDVEALGEEMKIRSIGGLREVEPASGKSTGAGLHSFGLAIDIGTTTGSNPYVKEKTEWKNPETGKKEKVKTATASVIDRAAQFVKYGMSAQFAIGNKASKGTGKTSLEKRVTQADQWWDIMHDASKAFKIYLQFATRTEMEVGGEVFRLEDLADAYGRETGDVRSVSEWQEQIKKDRETLEKDKDAFGKQLDKGFLNLDKRLVMALVKAGLSWGATIDKTKDIHHFGLYDGTIKFSKVSSTA